MIDFGLVFLTGLLASLHCVGMCGPIVLAYSAATGAGAGNRLWPLHLAYNAGRIVSYTALGAVVGIAGAALGSIQVFGGYFSIACGVLMVVGGLAILGLIYSPAAFFDSLIPRSLKKYLGGLLGRQTLSTKFLIGALTPLLPCGILYSMLIKAMGTGSAAAGACTMAFFALGMTPTLVLAGAASSLLTAGLRKWGEQLAALTVILLGLALIFRGLQEHGICSMH